MAANDLFSKADLQGAPEKVTLVIDPLIDGVTGAQSVATQGMEKRITDLVKKDYPRFEVTRFNSASVAKGPVVLIGTFTAINSGGAAAGPRDAYRICLALADLNTKKIISKGFPQPRTGSTDARLILRDSPVFGMLPPTPSAAAKYEGRRPCSWLSSASLRRNPQRCHRCLQRARYKQALDFYECCQSGSNCACSTAFT
jgi:hypothetical protein